MPLAAHPIVSFIIPVRDDARRLRRCLASIARNLYPADCIQVIVVDNESRDDTPQVARQAGALVVTSPGRVAELRNRGAREATGELLAFVDADHEIDVTWIRGAVHALSDPAFAAVGAPYSQPADANWIQRRYHELRAPIAKAQDTDWLGSGNLVVRRDVFAALNGFDAALEACEDVDLCNRLRRAGHRLLADPALRSVHFGDPSTLRALFLGELWRGRDNLRVTFRGPRTLKHLRSALIAVGELAAIAGAVTALATGMWKFAAVCAAVPAVLAIAKAIAMSRRSQRPGATQFLQALIVGFTYDLARALALLAGGTHAARRSAEHPLDATASSRS